MYISLPPALYTANRSGPCLMPTIAAPFGTSVRRGIWSMSLPVIRSFLSCDKGRVLLTQLSGPNIKTRSEEHTSELQSLMRISYAVFCLQKKKNTKDILYTHITI